MSHAQTLVGGGMGWALLCTALVAIAVVGMMAHLYRMIQQHAWHCIHCGRTSHLPKDVENHYCGACHHYCDEVPDDDGAWPPTPTPQSTDVGDYRIRRRYW
jgi:hypothetical protein